MVPELLISLPKLPLNPNGKVDRRALAELPMPNQAQGTAAQPPVTPTERLLAEIWAELLGIPVDSIGQNAHFFEVGGHSLLAGRVAARIRTRCRIDVPLRVFFDVPVLSRMAAWVEAAGGRVEPIGETSQIAGFADEDGDGVHAHLSSQMVTDTHQYRQEPTQGTRPQVLPLSFSQLRIWLIEQMGEGGDTYHIPLILELNGPLDAGLLNSAVSTLLERHEALRTVFPIVDDQPVQHILPVWKDPLELVRPDQPIVAGEEPWQAVCRQPFDLGTGPLSRFVLFESGEQRHVLTICLHHLVADGWSLSLLFRELGIAYQSAVTGQPHGLPRVFPYTDYALWQRRTYTRERMTSDLSWWENYLADLPDVLQLPADLPRKQGDRRSGSSISYQLPKSLCATLAGFATSRDTTLYVVLLSVYALVLHRFSGQGDLAVGSPIAGRGHEHLDNTIGCFINNLVVRSRPDRGQQSFESYLQNMREGVLDAFAHQDLPFEKLVEHLVGMRDTGSSPLFQVMFNLLTPEVDQTDMGDLTINAISSPNHSAQYELTLTALVGDGDIQGSLAYNADMFLPETAEFLLRQWIQTLQTVVERPEVSLLELFQPTETERAQLIAGFDRRTRAPVSSVTEWLKQHTLSRPNAPAVVADSTILTYSQLALAVHRLGLQLRQQGVGPGTVVGLSLNPDVTLVTAVLAAQWLGATYVCLDPKFPAERLAYMVTDSGCSLLLCETVPSWNPATLPVLHPQPDLSAGTPVWDQRESDPGEIAYMVYTSGTTGVPKGIAVPNRALWNMAASTATAYDLNRQDRVLQFAAMGFDVFAEEVSGTLAAGATLILKPREGFSHIDHFERHLQQHRVGVVNLPVSWWAEWLHALDQGEAKLPATLRMAIVGSEAVPRDKLDQWRRLAPHVALHNAYGPSETCVTATTWLDLDGDARSGGVTAPIGKPLAGLSISVRDARGHVVAPGFPGELHIGGAGLALGYLNLPARTASAFVPDPDGHGERLYKTGDLVRHLPGRAGAPGMLEFIGRRDTQVKIRGFRIELQEIEAVLRAIPGVVDAHVATKTERGGTRLVAYLVKPTEKQTLPTDEQINEALKKLPAYMVPNAWLWMDQLPLSPTGKIDGKKLPDTKAGVSSSNVPVDRVLLNEITAQWEEVLARPVPSPDTNFFEMGGNSLAAMRLLGKLGRAYNKRLTLAHFMNAATPRQTAILLAGSKQIARSLVTLRPAQQGSEEAPLYLIHGAAGTLTPFGPLAQTYPGTGAVFGFQAGDHEGCTIPELANRYIREAGLLQARTAVNLVGWSMGGLVAWEMAVRLSQAGKTVNTIMLDTYPLWRFEQPLSQLELVTDFALDMGLGDTDLVALGQCIPRNWDGVTLDVDPSVLPPSLAQLNPHQIQTFWRNYRAHHQAGRAYIPPQSVAPVLFAASEHGRRLNAAESWQAADYVLESREVKGSHGGLMEPPHVTALAGLILTTFERLGVRRDPPIGQA